MELIVESSGLTRCVYSDAIPLQGFGQVRIKRASNVEPNEQGEWIADLSPVSGPTLGPFLKRTDAIEAEVTWLNGVLSDAFSELQF